MASATKYDRYLEAAYDIQDRAEDFVIKSIGTDEDVQDVADNIWTLKDVKADYSSCKAEIRSYEESGH